MSVTSGRYFFAALTHLAASYDAAKEGDERFIQPKPPEGWEYDPNTGTFYESGELPPGKRPAAESINAAAIITFVTPAETGQIDDVTAGEHTELFSPWKPDIAYIAGNIHRYGNDLYRCLQSHTSQPDWTPDAAVSLWVRIADPAEEWPEWSQSIGTGDTYNIGDKVSHNGKHWISNVDDNVREPGVYGWTEYVEPVTASAALEPV